MGSDLNLTNTHNIFLVLCGLAIRVLTRVLIRYQPVSQRRDDIQDFHNVNRILSSPLKAASLSVHRLRFQKQRQVLANLAHCYSSTTIFEVFIVFLPFKVTSSSYLAYFLSPIPFPHSPEPVFLSLVFIKSTFFFNSNLQRRYLIHLHPSTSGARRKTQPSAKYQSATPFAKYDKTPTHMQPPTPTPGWSHS